MTDFSDSAARALNLDIASCHPVSGGSINNAWRIESVAGEAFFAKSRPGGSVTEFSDEAAGLEWLGEVGSLGFPAVAAVVDDAKEPGLVLEWVEPGPPGDDADLGRGLALLHRAGAERFDQLPPGASGNELRFGEVAVPLSPVDPGEGFATVYANRLRNLAFQAFEAGSLGSSDRDLIERVAERAGDLAGPIEPPARVHGDLWSGNLLWSGGQPRLIDPAAHGGHREIDLAMLELFGSPGQRFYDAYEDVASLDGGFRERVDLWQLQPLLVHATLFGGGYGRAAAVAARRLVA